MNVHYCDTCKHQEFPNPNRPESACRMENKAEGLECEIIQGSNVLYSLYSLYEVDEDKVEKNKELLLQKQFENKGW